MYLKKKISEENKENNENRELYSIVIILEK